MPQSLIWRSSDPGRKLVLRGVALGSQASAGHSRQACQIQHQLMEDVCGGMSRILKQTGTL